MKSKAIFGISLFLALAFFAAGGTKLLAMDPHPAQFAAFGLPAFAMYVVGLVEVAAAGLLLSKKTRFYGASLLVLTMIGAALTHIVTSVAVSTLGANALLGGLAAVVAWNTRPATVGTQAEIPT